VYNSQVVGIQRPGKNKPRSHKIYYKHNIDHHAYKKKSKGRVPITDKVKPGPGAISALKSKAGWAGIAIDAGFNIKDNILEGESTQRIVGDATVDVVAGVGTMAVAGALSALAIGSFGALILAGAAVGFGASYIVGKALGFNWRTSQSLKAHGKDLVQAGTNAVKGFGKTVAGWFK